jgi:uncharacterized protein
MSRRSLLWLILCAGVALLLLASTLFYMRESACPLRLGDTCYEADWALTDMQRQRGLSGRSDLGQRQAMVFVFGQAARQCMWMKDMLFSLDMIWLDDNKRVVMLKENATPQSYPESFCSDKPSKYVLEVNVGVIRAQGLHVGDSVNL